MRAGCDAETAMPAATGYRTALVTGASRGIGRAITQTLVREGLEVWGLARASADLDALVAGTGCHGLAVDLLDAGAVDRALEGLRIDVLVNNAGIIPAVGPFAEFPAAELGRTIDLNLRAPMAVTRALLPGMVERRRGHVFAITSLFGPYAGADVAVYAATKAALRSFCACLRAELAGSGVRVTEIAPGRTRTGIYLDAFGGDAGALEQALFRDRRALQPDDVAQALVAALRLPPRADAAIIELAPTDQAAAGLAFAGPPAGTGG